MGISPFSFVLQLFGFHNIYFQCLLNFDSYTCELRLNLIIKTIFKKKGAFPIFHKDFHILKCLFVAFTYET